MIIDGAGRNALDIGLLNHRRQSLRCHTARLKKAREIAACAKLGNAQLDGASAVRRENDLLDRFLVSLTSMPVVLDVTLGKP